MKMVTYECCCGKTVNVDDMVVSGYDHKCPHCGVVLYTETSPSKESMYDDPC